MKKTNTASSQGNTSHRRPILAALVASALAAPSAHAATVDWTGAGGNTSWQTPANWSSTPSLPGAGDDVNIGPVPLVVFGASGNPIASIQSLASDAIDFRLQGGTLSIAESSFIANLTRTGGTLGGTGTVTAAQSSLTGGIFKDAGSLILGGNGTHAIGGSAVSLDGGRIVRNNGTLKFDSGALSNLAVNLNTGGSQTGSGKLENYGTTGFVTYLNRQTSFVASNNGATDDGTSASFDNFGTLNKSGTGTVVFNVAFNNSGTVNLSADAQYGNTYGNFQLDRGSSHATGSLLTGTGQIMLSGGTHTLASGSTVTIEKLQTFGSATFTLLAGADFRPNVFLHSANGTTTIQVGAGFAPTSFEMANGTVDFLTGSITLPAATKFSSGTLRGTGTLTANNATVLGGTFKDAGTLVLQGNTSFGSAGITIDSGRTLRNQGTATFDSGPSVNWVANLNPTGISANSGYLVNEGVLEFKTYLNRTHTIVAANNIASAIFDNESGALVKKRGDGSITLGVTTNNRGTIDVGAGYSPYGINFYGGKLDHQSGGVLTGTGGILLQVSGSSFRSGSTTTIENIYVWGATTIESGAQFDPKNLYIRGGHTVTRTGSDPMIWRTQSLQADGKLLLPMDVPLVLQGGQLLGAGSVEMTNWVNASQAAVDVRGATINPGGGNLSIGDFYAGTLGIVGGLRMAANSNTEIDFIYQGGALTNPLVAVDKIAVSGNAEIGGVLTLELGTNLSAANLQGRSFVILTSKQLSGTYSHIAGIGNWGNNGYAVDYFDSADADTLIDSVRITFNNIPLPPPPVPEPETYALMLAGLALIRLRAKRRSTP